MAGLTARHLLHSDTGPSGDRSQLFAVLPGGVHRLATVASGNGRRPSRRHHYRLAPDANYRPTLLKTAAENFGWVFAVPNRVLPISNFGTRSTNSGTVEGSSAGSDRIHQTQFAARGLDRGRPERTTSDRDCVRLSLCARRALSHDGISARTGEGVVRTVRERAARHAGD